MSDLSKHMCTPPPSSGGGGGLSLLSNFQKGGGGLTRSSFLEGVAGEEGLPFSGGWVAVFPKRKLTKI